MSGRAYHFVEMGGDVVGTDPAVPFQQIPHGLVDLGEVFLVVRHVGGVPTEAAALAVVGGHVPLDNT